MRMAFPAIQRMAMIAPATNSIFSPYATAPRPQRQQLPPCDKRDRVIIKYLVNGLPENLPDAVSCMERDLDHVEQPDISLYAPRWVPQDDSRRRAVDEDIELPRRHVAAVLDIGQTGAPVQEDDKHGAQYLLPLRCLTPCGHKTKQGYGEQPRHVGHEVSHCLGRPVPPDAGRGLVGLGLGLSLLMLFTPLFVEYALCCAIHLP